MSETPEARQHSQHHPPHRAVIAGTGSYLPERRMTNDDLAKLVDTTDEWIVQRTGIKERRVAAADEPTSVLASRAATRALKDAHLEAKDLDLILVATITPDMMTPAAACFVAHSLGLDRTPAVDLNAACSGFVYGLQFGSALIESGRYRNVLLVGADKLSSVTDYSDRTSCILWGDGAGAAVLSASDDQGPRAVIQRAPRRRRRVGADQLPGRQPPPDQREDGRQRAAPPADAWPRGLQVRRHAAG